ncbi:hypothetical protein CALVIDRAFT_569801 [Calocera viscosa TUFC12733]|uniref:Uncharacterized protein n=1 Tax=Calocera viscosa (strain TUFC12733) TaxID=1330018 RepID=A0A167FJX1_CALVF|nr:hypothetical protein CALVIDRAFT_569801 [Calocera viscosa TUFC12733]
MPGMHNHFIQEFEKMEKRFKDQTTTSLDAWYKKNKHLLHAEETQAPSSKRRKQSSYSVILLPATISPPMAMTLDAYFQRGMQRQQYEEPGNREATISFLTDPKAVAAWRERKGPIVYEPLLPQLDSLVPGPAATGTVAPPPSPRRPRLTRRPGAEGSLTILMAPPALHPITG